MPTCIVVGASCRALAESMIDAGFDVIAIDLYGDRDLQSIAQTYIVENLTLENIQLPQLEKLPKQTLVALAGGMEDQLASVEWLEDRFALLGPSSSQIKTLRDRSFWKMVAASVGLGFPQTLEHPPSTHSDFHALSWLWKPRYGAGGVHIKRIEIGPNTDLDRLQNGSTHQGYWQQEINGTPFGCVFNANEEHCELVSISRSLTESEWAGPTPFIYRGSLFETTFPDACVNSLKLLGAAVHSAIPFVGWFGVDIILDHSGQVWLLEINPRWTASMELSSLAGSRNWMTDLGDGSKSNRVTSESFTLSKSSIGKGICYAANDILLDQECLDRLWLLRRHRGGEESWIADIPSKAQTIPQGYPMFSLFAAGPTPIKALERLIEFQSALNREQIMIVAS